MFFLERIWTHDQTFQNQQNFLDSLLGFSRQIWRKWFVTNFSNFFFNNFITKNYFRVVLIFGAEHWIYWHNIPIEEKMVFPKGKVVSVFQLVGKWDAPIVANSVKFAFNLKHLDYQNDTQFSYHVKWIRLIFQPLISSSIICLRVNVYFFLANFEKSLRLHHLVSFVLQTGKKR